MKINKTVKLSLNQFDASPCAQLDSNTIKIPTWFLFKYDDIPLQFRITELDDPRLTDQNYLNDLAEWMNERFREAGLSSVIRRSDHGILQGVIKLMRDRNLYEKSKDFILCHELSHVNHVQVGQRTFNLSQMKEAISMVGIIGGILLLFLAVAIVPFVHLTMTLAVGGIAVMISLLGLAWFGKTRSVSDIEEEKSADIDAVEILQDAAGGIYYFETRRQRNMAIRRSDPTQTSIDENGNNLRDKTHPPLTERIAYLKQWQSQYSRV